MNPKELLYSQFDRFPKVVIENNFPELLNESSELIKDVEDEISDYYRSTLIYLINEKRIEKNLIGDSPESRYEYFNNVLCQNGLIFEEIDRRFPSINQRVMSTIKKRLELINFVKERFTLDFKELRETGYIYSEAQTPKISEVKIKITGDIHNGCGVCILSYEEQKVVFKKKSSNPNVLLHELNIEVSKFLQKDIDFIPDFLDKGEYFWEKFVSSSPLRTEEDAKEFYRRMGYLLSYSYILNISDLHFENLISTSFSPKLVDVETVFSVSPYQTVANNESTLEIINNSRNSILSTGLLPVSEAGKVFGGDTSGVLGGTLIGEAKIVINHNRDDIHVEKQKFKTENQDHLPYFIDSKGMKEFLNAEDYVEYIKEGFREVSYFFMNSQDFLKKLYIKHNDIKTRILFRNTRDYSLVRQLLVSPVYCEQSEILFETMANKLSEQNSRSLCLSEKKQLLNMDIPYFYSNIDSCDIKDENMIIWNLKSSALSEAINKLEKLSEEIINEQIELIEFSIKTPKALYSTELQEAYQKFEKVSSSENIIKTGIDTLVDIILENESNSLKDDSTNWLTLKVTDYDAFELVPMDDSLYEGLSGIAISLSEAYDFLDSGRQRRVKECLKRIFSVLSNSYMKLPNHSFFMGKLGIYSALKRISVVTGQEIQNSIMNYNNLKYTLDVDVLSADFLSSFPNEVTALRNSDIKIDNLTQALDKLKELAIVQKDFISWDKLESNNVSLAHGNLGVEIALLYLAGKLESPEALNLFHKAKMFDKHQKLENGWIDKRNSSTSANWCHGSTGVLVARLAQLKLDDEYSLLSHSERIELENDMKHAAKQILEIGFDMTNFSLCHGTSGNLLALTYYQSYLTGADSEKLKEILDREYRKLHSFGLENGWMCSFNTKYNVYGLMTGVSGILFSTVKYMKGDDSLDVLIPNF